MSQQKERPPQGGRSRDDGIASHYLIDAKCIYTFQLEAA